MGRSARALVYSTPHVLLVDLVFVSLRESELSCELLSTPPDTNRGLASAKQPVCCVALSHPSPRLSVCLGGPGVTRALRGKAIEGAPSAVRDTHTHTHTSTHILLPDAAAASSSLQMVRSAPGANPERASRQPTPRPTTPHSRIRSRGGGGCGCVRIYL